MQRGDVLRDRKFYIFLGLVVILILVNLSEWRQAAKTASVREQEAKKKLRQVTSVDPILMAGRLTEEKREFSQEKRNIFTFFQSQPVQRAQQTEQQAPPPPPDPVCGNSVCEAGEDLTNCPGDCQPPPPPAPVISLRYIGFLSEPQGSVAFLTDGKEVYMGRVNDVIANQYRVLKITEDSIELGFLNNNQSSTIRFQGNQGG